MRSKHCCRRVARSRRPSVPQGRARSPTPRSTTTPSATGRASGPQQALALDWHQRVGHDPRVGPAVREVVRRRQAQRLRTTASTATSTPATATRSRSTGRASPATRARSPTSELLDETCRVANAAASRSASRRATASRSTWAWCPRPSPRCSRARASARAHSVVFGGFTAQSLQGPHQRRARRKVLDHRRRRVAARLGRRRSRTSPTRRSPRRRRSSTCSCCGAPRTTSRCRTAATSGGTTSSPRQTAECAPRVDGRRGPALHPLHVGHHREAQGHHAHDRRLPHAGRVHAQVRVRPAARHRRLLVHRRRRLGHRPLVHRLRPAREPRDDACSTRARPTIPDKDRLWSIVEKYKVTIFYTAPTAIRTFMKWGDEFPRAHDLSSLRLIGTVGEPINPEAWVWYWQTIGGERCPVVDTWWQTETGAIMISALPGRDHAEARAARRSRCPGSRPSIVDDAGQAGRHPRRRLPRARRGRGRRCCAASGATRSATATPTGARFDGKYFAGDGAKRDDDGYFWLLGRVDDIMLVAGPQHLDHRGRVGARRPSRGRRGRGRRPHRRRPPARRSPRSSSCAAASSRATSSSRSCATTSPSSSARSRSRSRSCSPRSCRRRARARSCAGCCATSPRTRRSATPRRSPIPTVVDGIKARYLAVASRAEE